jgi:hypothetical protein
MALYQRGDVWHYDFTVKGVRYRGSTGLRGKTAARKVEDRERELATLGEPRAELTIEQAAAKWFTARQAGTKSEKTTAQRLEIMLRLIGPGTLVSNIDAPEVEEAMQARRLETTRQRRAPTNSTVNRDLIDTTLRPILRYTKRVLKQRVNEIEWTELRLSEPKERDRTFTEAEIAAWREALPPWHREVFDFAARYGVRLREAFFPLDCVDATAGRIMLRDRKNGRGHNLRLLPEDAARIAALYGRAKDAGLDTLWFREKRSGALSAIHWRGFQSASRKALDRAKITDARPAHDLRHHALTKLVSKTGNLAAAKRLAGHDNIASTMRYVHADDDDVFEAMRHAYATSDVTVPKTVVESTTVSGT